MSSFSWVSRFREGSWRTFRKFMLEERSSVSERFLVIDAERERIGDLRVLYKFDEVQQKVTEERVGISIEPENSSLAKLLQAYCALGGNPFDISMFMYPDNPLEVSQAESQSGQSPRNEFPGQGVAFMQDISYSFDQGAKDGDLNLVKYKTSRVGGTVTLQTEPNTSEILTVARRFIIKEIYNKRVRIEEQIIKLCDLREQLDQEVTDMVWAMYGDMAAGEDFDPQRFNIDLTAARIAYRFDSTFRVPDDDYGVKYDDDAAEGEPGSKNSEALAGYANLISDEEVEKNTAL